MLDTKLRCERIEHFTYGAIEGSHGYPLRTLALQGTSTPRGSKVVVGVFSAEEAVVVQKGAHEEPVAVTHVKRIDGTWWPIRGAQCARLS